MAEPLASEVRAPWRTAPAPAPPTHFDARAEIAARLLQGRGIEIGALHAPLVLPPWAEVRYVDRLSTEQLRAEYPELVDEKFVDVDIVDDGERLAAIEDASLDFLVANHFLEHCENPIGTIGTHLSKLAPGGALFYAVPDKRFTFDTNRPTTELAHVSRDHDEGPEWSRSDHYSEWASRVYPDETAPQRDDQTNEIMARDLDDAGYSIHFHVWTQAELLELILHCRARFDDAFDLEVAWRRSLELILVLRKAGQARTGPFLPQTSIQLERQLLEARRDVVRLSGEAASLQERVDRGDRVLASVMSSASWRLTAPLRSAKGRVSGWRGR